MQKSVFLSPNDLGGINAISQLGNSTAFLEYLKPIDYHFLFFSNLYQSGTTSFQLDVNGVPLFMKENAFWKEKFLDIDWAKFKEATLKACELLEGNFDLELDNKYHAPQHSSLVNYFSILFYSADTGIPFICYDYPTAERFEFLQTRLSAELYHSIINLHSVIKADDVPSIIPQYSVFKKDFRRFEDIAHSRIYTQYAKSVDLLSQDTKIDSAKKEIKQNALRVYNKYARHLDLRKLAFSVIRFNKKVVDLFGNKFSSVLGDYLIDSIEDVTAKKRKIVYYDFHASHYMIHWGNRFGELMSVGGKDKLDAFLNDFRANREHKE